MKVRVKNSLADMCKGLIESGINFTFGNNSITAVGYYDFCYEMLPHLGKEIELDKRGCFDYAYYSPYMYDIVGPKHRQFKNILEIPDNAVFRKKDNPLLMFKVTSQFDSSGNIILCCGSSGSSGKVLIDSCEMTLDSGKNWGVAGVLE